MRTPRRRPSPWLFALSVAAGAADPRPAWSEGAAGKGPIVEKFGVARVDFSGGVVLVEGAAAADPHAPNAGVARVRAENLARSIAARRLAVALSQVSLPRLGCPSRPSQATIDAAAARAPTERIEWSSDGSVTLELRVPLAELAALPAQHALVPDGGVPGPAVLLVQVGEQPTWFHDEAGRCVPAPRHFETVSEARAAGGELASADLVLSRQALVRDEDRNGRGPFRPPPRVIGVARRDDTGVGGGR